MVAAFNQKLNHEKINQLISDNLIDVVWVVDADSLKYEFVTPSVESISGYAPKELIDTALYDRIAPDSLKSVQAILAKAKKEYSKGKATTHTLELELIHKNKHSYWIEVTAKFFKERNKPLKIIGVSRDISKRKQGELQREELVAELQATIAEKETLLKENRLLHALLPICSGCRRIRDEHNRWWPLEEYVRKQTHSDFTHTICPGCEDVIYSDELK